MVQCFNLDHNYKFYLNGRKFSHSVFFAHFFGQKQKLSQIKDNDIFTAVRTQKSGSIQYRK